MAGQQPERSWTRFGAMRVLWCSEPGLRPVRSTEGVSSRPARPICSPRPSPTGAAERQPRRPRGHLAGRAMMGRHTGDGGGQGWKHMSITHTSENNPLRIAEVRPRPDHGRIGITLCPGKKDDGGMSGRHDRNLAVDLDAVRDWGAAAVARSLSAEQRPIRRHHRSEVGRQRLADAPRPGRAPFLERRPGTEPNGCGTVPHDPRRRGSGGRLPRICGDARGRNRQPVARPDSPTGKVFQRCPRDRRHPRR